MDRNQTNEAQAKRGADPIRTRNAAKTGQSHEAAGIDRSGTLDQGAPIPSRASQALSNTCSESIGAVALVARSSAGTLGKARCHLKSGESPADNFWTKSPEKAASMISAPL
jgi:hypothetical protein